MVINKSYRRRWRQRLFDGFGVEDFSEMKDYILLMGLAIVVTGGIFALIFIQESKAILKHIFRIKVLASSL